MFSDYRNKFVTPEVAAQAVQSGDWVDYGFGAGFPELMDKALELANAIAANAQVAVRQSKAAIRRGLQTDMNTGVAYESEAFALCFATEDQKDAMHAFLRKEKLSTFKNK